MAIITARNTRTGKRVEVPETWIGHPKFGVDLERETPTSTPDQPSGAKKARLRAAETPAPGDEKE